MSFTFTPASGHQLDRPGRYLILDIADPNDWQHVRRDPYPLCTSDSESLDQSSWRQGHSTAFLPPVDAASEVVDEYLDGGEPDPDGQRLYLFLHPDSAAYAVVGPTLELLDREHPRLPATFYHLFTGALNRWVRKGGASLFGSNARACVLTWGARWSESNT